MAKAKKEPSRFQWKMNHYIGLILILILFLAAVAASITIGAAKIDRKAGRIQAGYRRTPFGRFIAFIAGNPIMPIVSILSVIGFVGFIMFAWFPERSQGVEFFVESEPEQAIVYVRARGNMGLNEKDAIVQQVEDVILQTEGIQSAFAFAGSGGLNANTGGVGGPRDAIGQVQIELIPWEDRAAYARSVDGLTFDDLDGNVVLAELQRNLDRIPGIYTEVTELAQGPGAGKPIHLRLSGDNQQALFEATEIVRERFESTPALVDLEDSRPLPGIDWQINVDVEKAGRYGADVATVGGMVQLVTRGILLDTMRVPTSDDEIEIRVRLPEQDRVLSTLDTLKVRTADGLVPLSNFIAREPVAKLAQIDRVDQERYFDVKADFVPGLQILRLTPLDEGGDAVENGAFDVGFGFEVSAEDVAQGADYNVAVRGERGWLARQLFGTGDRFYNVPEAATDVSIPQVNDQLADGEAEVSLVPVNANERIAVLTTWLESQDPLPSGVTWEWTGDQEEQAESGQFLMTAFAGALGLMFIILLAQFNSFYNATLVLLAVVLSTTGVLIGMGVMSQPFSIIMTGTGIVALAGIVVNNNIVLIDTYQEYSRYMPRVEAIIRTTEVRIRPVLLTTITTMAGLTPMMLGISLDFFGGGFTVDSPTALWWKQLATAVVFGLGVATLLTLVFTPSMLAARVWLATYFAWFMQLLSRLSMGRASRAGQDWALRRAARKVKAPEILWDTGQTTAVEEVDAAPLSETLEALPDDDVEPDPASPLKAAE